MGALQIDEARSNLLVSFSPAAGKPNQLQTSETLIEAVWSNAAPVLTTDSVSSVTITLTNAPTPRRFFRVLITAPAITASVTTTTVGMNANVPARRYTWQDEDGEPRAALMLDQSATRAGVLRQMSYTATGSNRVCSAIPSNEDAIQGMGYVVNHLGIGTPWGNWSATAGANSGGTTKVIFAGRHHTIIQYSLPKYKSNTNVVPTYVQWLFATGRSHPLFCVTQDARAYTNGNLGADSRSPYGTLNIAGDNRNLPAQDYLVGGVSWGDTYKFVSVQPDTTNESSTLLRSSGWRYNESNTIPYAMAWMTGANAEQGTVATTSISRQDHASDPRTWPQTGFLKNQQDLNGPIVTNDDWAYQMMNYPYIPVTGTTDTKIGWGMNFGALGGFDNWGDPSLTNLTQYSCHRDSTTPWTGSRASGLFLSYSTFIVLGEHTGGYRGGATGKMVTQMENHQAAALTAQVGQILTQGPASRSITNAPSMVYSPAGYDPIYAAWNAVAATNSAILLTLTPAAGKPLYNPMFHISNYQTTNPPAVSIDGKMGCPDADYFASVDATTHELWLTLNRNVGAPCVITWP